MGGDTTQYVLDLAATLPLVLSDTETGCLCGRGSEGGLACAPGAGATCRFGTLPLGRPGPGLRWDRPTEHRVLRDT